TKATLVWQDRDGNGQVNTGEVVGVGASAGLPAQNFKRWLVGADLGVDVTTGAGVTHVFGELSTGNNMDRSLYVADPITIGRDQRELGYYVSLVHELGQGKLGGYDLGGVVLGPIVGLRYDVYNPNSDFLGADNGKIVPRTETVRTW